MATIVHIGVITIIIMDITILAIAMGIATSMGIDIIIVIAIIGTIMVVTRTIVAIMGAHGEVGGDPVHYMHNSQLVFNRPNRTLGTNLVTPHDFP